MSVSKDSKYDSLNDTLGAIGKAVFVNYYYDFKNTDITTEELSTKLAQTNPGSRSARQGFRIPRARHIFEENQQLDALRIIIDSARVESSARDRAREILLNEMSQVPAYQVDIADEQSFIMELGAGFIPEDSIPQYDNVPKPAKSQTESTLKKYARDRHVAVRALAKANYRCEVDPNHKTFIRKNSSMSYTEPHHLIPLSASKYFSNIDLDREQNVVSLCSHCHNLLHYGDDIEPVLQVLYEDRKDLLKAIGADISFEDLISCY